MRGLPWQADQKPQIAIGSVAGRLIQWPTFTRRAPYLPQMLARKEGYLLQTVSAAGLLTSLGSAPYAVTKHAALGFAEWLAITYGEQGIRVSALCPQGVLTNMLKADYPGTKMLLAGAIEPEQVADDVIKAMAEEKFMILPHPEAVNFFRTRRTITSGGSEACKNCRGI